MAEISDYQNRIAAALDRIRQGLEQKMRAGGEADAGGTRAAALSEALARERTANAQLTDLVRALRNRQEKAVQMLERRVLDLTAALDSATEESQRQKRLVGQLADSNRALLEAAEKGVADPQLLNLALQRELEALRAARDVEIAEIGAILKALAPVIDPAAAPDAGKADMGKADKDEVADA